MSAQRRSGWVFLVFLALVGLAAAVGSHFEPGAWYEALDKPPSTPPNVVFPIAWTLLYLGMAWSGWRFWRADPRSWALVAWGVQLVLNAAWSWLFFGLNELALAWIEIRVLWLAIVVTIGLGFRLDRTAALALLPYLAWVTSASWLNFEIWMRNAGS